MRELPAAAIAPASLGRGPHGAASGSLPTLSLRANFAWTLAGNIVYAGCQWGMLVALAKLGSPEMVGAFALGLAVTAPVVLFTNLQLRGVQASDAHHEHTFGEYLALRMIMALVALGAIGAIIGGAGYRGEQAWVIAVVGVAKVIESLSDIFYGLLQYHERMDRIAASMMIKGPLSLVALAAGVAITHSVLWGAMGLVVVWALVLAGYDVRNGATVLRAAHHTAPTSLRASSEDSIRPRWDARRLLRLGRLALPLGFVMMLVSLTTNVPRYFLQHDTGTRELGIFASLSYLMVAGTTVVDALGQSATPRLSKHFAAGDLHAFRTLLARLLGIGALLGGAGVAGGALVGRQALSLLYRPEYALHADVLVWLLAASGVGYLCSVMGYGLTAARRFVVQVPLNLASVAMVALASALLIPRYGLRGAAWATFLVLLTQLPLRVAIVLRALRHRAAEEAAPREQQEVAIP